MMKKNFFWMSANLSSKLLVNFVIFALLARFISKHEFGELVFYYAVAGVVTIITDYGFNLYTVKEMAKNEHNWKKTFHNSLQAKLILAMVITILIFSYTILTSGNDYLLLCFYFSGIFLSFTSYLLLPLRIFNKFKIESIVSISSNIGFFLIIIILAFNTKSLEVIAFGFLLVRFFVLFLILIIFKEYITGYKLVSIRSSLKLLKINFPYGLHLIVGTIYFQVDTFILNHFSDYSSIAEYQSAFRIIMAALIITEVMTNILLPKLSSIKNSVELKKLYNLYNLVLLLFGAIISILLFILSPYIIRIVYGPGYEGSIILLKVLSIMLLFRYMSTVDGIILTVWDKQMIRTVFAIVALIINAVSSVILIYIYDSMGAAIASTFTSMVLVIMYKIYINFRIRVGMK